ncbi:MAG: hypothetical protein WCP28_19025, partial [Actinomycetes bacterium]
MAAGCIVLIATPFFTQPADRFSSWSAWGYAVTLSVACSAGIGLKRWWQVMIAISLLTVLYLAATLPAATSMAQTTTALTNSLSYLMFAAVVRVPANFIRRLAVEAENARAQVAALARDAERSRHRLLLHDQASVLALLSSDEIDPELAAVIRNQAAQSAHRVRRFISDEPDPTLPLAQQLTAVIAEFPDLDPELNVDQVTCDVPDDVLDAVTDAVRTLLHNVRNHAHAGEVVVHATTDDNTWSVQVS